MNTPDAINFIHWTWEALCALGPAFFLGFIAWRMTE